MTNDIGIRLVEHGARLIKVVESLPNTLVGRHVAGQLLRSGTSAGANYEEACGAESKADFAHKLQISLKELRESNYWLRLLVKSGKLTEKRIVELRRVKSIARYPLEIRRNSERKGEGSRQCLAPLRGKPGERTKAQFWFLTFAF